MSAEPQSAELQPGQVFEGKYKILRELGRGGFGMVYLAYQESMDRHVALKVLKSSVTAQAPSAKERFLREVKIISKLKHPNTVTIHDFGETFDGGLYMVLEFVEGETLKQVLKREGAQDALRAADLARQIARSLAEAHRHGVVHRDLKPANIMITSIEADKDFVKVLDFGVARLLDPKTNDLTSVGLPEGERELIGTPRYMSPEQVRGESLTGASDIYGLGLMFYEMVSGEPAVQGDTTMGLITQQISPEPLKLFHLGHFSPAVQDIIRIATAKRLHDRFQTAEQMADALESCTFQLRRERNLTGPQGGDVPMASYQSQLSGVQPGWAPQQQQQSSGWHSNTPSGNWAPHQSGPQVPVNYDPNNPFGSGFHSGQVPHPQHHSQPPQMQPNPYQSGMQPAPYQPQQAARPTSGYNEIQLPVDDDFKPTIERSALDANHSGRSQQLFDRNQYPSSELPSADLPPVPVDERPFDARQQANPPTGPVPAAAPSLAGASHSLSMPAARPKGPPEETMGEFTIGVAKICILGTLAALAMYAFFLIMGAWLESFLSGSSRLIAAAVLSVGVFVLVALAEGTRKERFRVIDPTTERIAGVFAKTLIGCLLGALVLSAGFARAIVNELQGDPNWYLEEQESRGFSSFNKKASYGLADGIVAVMEPIGLYKVGGARTAKPGAAPGRTKALPAPTRKGNQQRRAVDPNAPKSEIPSNSEKSDRYVDW